ncbi:hypothetical protein AOLI_G00103120 [Acnodon oligacanthus]
MWEMEAQKREDQRRGGGTSKPSSQCVSLRTEPDLDSAPGRSQDPQRQATPPPDSELPSSAQPQMHPIPPPPTQTSVSSSPPLYALPTLYDGARALMEQAAGEVAPLTEEPSLKVTTPPSLTPVGSSSNPFLGTPSTRTCLLFAIQT